MLKISNYNVKKHKAKELQKFVKKNEKIIAEHAPKGWKYMGTYCYVLGFGPYHVAVIWEISNYSDLDSIRDHDDQIFWDLIHWNLRFICDLEFVICNLGYYMLSEDPLSKRIKRHVIGRRHNFFVATSPGFEPICLQELLKLKPAAGEACVTPGGVEFEGRLDDCYLANLNLRSANRILMRIHTFKSSNFRKLEKKLWPSYCICPTYLDLRTSQGQI